MKSVAEFGGCPHNSNANRFADCDVV